LISLASPTQGCPVLRVLGERRVPRTHTQRGLCRTAKSCVVSIAAHPCKKRKDGEPSVGTAHAKIVKGGPPAHHQEEKIEIVADLENLDSVHLKEMMKKR
jgi:hypothetical protein